MKDPILSNLFIILALSIGMFIRFAVGIYMGDAKRKDLFHTELINRGHAEYHQTTGEWRWKE